MKRAFSEYSGNTDFESQGSLFKTRRIEFKAMVRNGKRSYKSYPRRSKKSGRKSIKAMVNAAILSRSETKYSQNTAEEITVTQQAPPTFFDFSTILQGLESNNRIANKIFATRIGVRTLYNNNSASDGTYLREVILEVDGGRYQTNTDIVNALYEGGQDATYAGTIVDIVRKLNKDGLRVLNDRTINLSAQTVASFDSGNAGFKWSKKINRTLIYRDSGNAQPINKRYTVMVMSRDPARDAGLAVTEATVCTETYFKDV